MEVIRKGNSVVLLKLAQERNFLKNCLMASEIHAYISDVSRKWNHLLILQFTSSQTLLSNNVVTITYVLHPAMCFPCL